MKSYNSVSAFQRACLQSTNAKNNFLAICDLYKKILDSNFSNRFCLGDHCKLMFMVEIKYDDSKWGATPKMFSTKDEAEKEAEALKIKYPFIRECRIITRKLKETGRNKH